ncbi:MULTISPECIES: restriction endonuclease subunit S [Providencia]|uniref:restriction endonuclease subunit S n=1 Tax=Providencia TaxID=586 RepID=UPI0021D493E8|nr:MULTISPECIES: restriction endonuclease subunit S [Providencia]WIE07919.1 restriction endonuclease subunit S [Providencia rettgeri]
MTVEKLITDHIDIWSSALQTRSTAGRGSSGKIDLYGIKKLRELILELAVRGKLVPQDPNDEPASELLKRIAAEKAELVKQGKIKKQKPLPEISEDEKPFELPEGWEWTSLNEIALINPKIEVTNDEQEISFVPMPCISTRFDGTHDQEIKKWGEVKKGYTHFADGDIALAKITPCFENSKAVIFEGLKNGVGVGTTELHVARPLSSELNLQYILLNIKAPHYLTIGELQMTGSAGQKRVPRSFFENYPIPFPPKTEQARIVETFSELMSLCDQLEQQSLTSLEAHQQLVETLLATLTDSQNEKELSENWSRINQHFDTLFTTEASIDALKQTILQLAVMGLLIENAEFSQRSHLKKHLSFGPRNGLSPSEVKYETDVKVLKLGATSYGYLKLQETKYVDIDTSDKLHLFLRKGDILIQRGNSSNFVGCSLLIEKDFDNLIYPDLMMKIRTKDELFPEYAALWLSSPFARNYMWSKMTGTSGTMPKISKKVVEDVPIAVPPLAVQHQLVIKIKKIFFLCDSLKSRLQLAQQTQLHLADALTDAALN